MIVQQTYLNTPGIVAIVIIYSALAITLDQMIAAIEARLTAWTERSKIVSGDILTDFCCHGLNGVIQANVNW